jgi:ribosomal protein S18 acetylase RimI-like enzyme
MADAPAILTLEALSNRMWPAEQQMDYDGWLLQFAGGYTRRPNSASILRPSSLPVEEKVRVCEAAYERRGLPPLFKVVPALGLDEDTAVVERLGYRHNASNLVMTADLSAYAAAEAQQPDDYPAWMAAFIRMKALPTDKAQAHARILGRIQDARIHSHITAEGRIAAVGLGVVGDGWCGIFDVVTDPALRGRGLAQRMMRQLLAQAVALGAVRAFLQVDAHNTPALRLYETLGFAPLYTYTYLEK